LWSAGGSVDGFAIVGSGIELLVSSLVVGWHGDCKEKEMNHGKIYLANIV
jgi:hypothetical protein